MKKYIDADLLRKKITEEMDSVPREVGRGAGTITSKGYGMMQAFQIVRSIIDSLQQEQPDNEDIDKVAQELYEHLYELKRRNNVPTNLYDKQEIINLWKAGIEYGRNHPKLEQPVSEELNGAAIDFADIVPNKETSKE